MKLIQKKNALKIFYYLMAVDGTISEEELLKLDEIGLEFMEDAYEEYKAEMSSQCADALAMIPSSSEEAYDFISEQVDVELSGETEDMMDGIPSRLLVWDLFIMAHADNDFAERENRLLKHIARKLALENSVIFEMEQYIKAEKAIEREQDILRDSMEPYAIVRPVVEHLTMRQETLKRCVTGLIADEMIVPVEKLKVQDDVFDKAAARIQEKANPLVRIVGENADKLMSGMKEAAALARPDTVQNSAESYQKIKKAFGGVGARLLKQTDSEAEDKEGR